MKNPEDIPEWLAKDTTYLLPKTSGTKNPNNYRPTTSLSTTYKLLTSIIITHIFIPRTKKMLPCEKKGCRMRSNGCKDQLLISRMIIENCH